MNLKILIFLSTLTFSCIAPNKSGTSRNPYFEGVVTYEISYQPYSDRFQEKDLQESIGSKMMLSFKDGNLKKEYFSSNGALLYVRYLHVKEKKAYSTSPGSDTIYWIDLTKNDSKTIFSRIADTTILSQQTIGIETKTTTISNDFPNQVFQVSGNYFYSTELRVDPNWYQNCIEGNYDEIIQIGKGIQLLMINNGVFWTQKMTAVKIEKRDVSLNEVTLKLPKKAVLKEL